MTHGIHLPGHTGCSLLAAFWQTYWHVKESQDRGLTMFSWAPREELAVIPAASSKLIPERFFCSRLWPEEHGHFRSLTTAVGTGPADAQSLGGKCLLSNQRLKNIIRICNSGHTLHVILYFGPSVNLIRGLLQPN